MSKNKAMYCELDHDLIMQTIAMGIKVGLDKGFAVACAVVDSVGRSRGVIRHEEAGYMTTEFATGKARLSSSTRSSTKTTFDRLQKERPLYGATIASLNGRYDWFLAEGGAPVNVKHGDHQVLVAAVGVSGCLPAAIDQEIADEVAEWMASQVKL